MDGARLPSTCVTVSYVFGSVRRAVAGAELEYEWFIGAYGGGDVGRADVHGPVDRQTRWVRIEFLERCCRHVKVFHC